MYDINLIKSCWLSILVSERHVEPIVIEKANQFVSFKFDIFQFLNILNLLDGATNPDSLLKAYKTSDTRGVCWYEWFNQPDKLKNKELPPYVAFHNKLRNCNHLERSTQTTESWMVWQQSLSGQNEALWITTNWSRELFLHAETASKGKNAVIQTILRWYNKKRRCPNIAG